ncbi:MAG: recombinase family protein [Ktedonobacteraceae bacterium]
MPKQKASGKVQRTTQRAVVYSRVSGHKQEYEGTSLDTQEENGIAYAEAHGYVVVKVVRETWTGWELTERKKLSEIREMGRNDEFDVLIFNTIDRLARNKTHFSVLVYEADHFGFRLECVKENIDNSPMGQYIRDTYGLFAELERAKIIDRTQTGRMRRVRNGKLLPGVKAKYGYTWGGENKDFLVIKEDEAAILREMFTYFTTVKTSCNGLTRMLTEKGVPSPSGRMAWNRAVVYDLLTDPIYMGEAYAYRYDGHHLRPKEEWIRLPDGVAPPIIDRDTFELTQKLLQINRQDSIRRNPWEPTELLRCGFVRCGYCNRVMVVNRYTRKKKSGVEEQITVYACRHFYKDGAAPKCPFTPSIIAKRLDEAVWAYIGELLEDFTLVEKAIGLARKKKSFKADLQSVEGSIRYYEESQKQIVADISERNDKGEFLLKGQARKLMLIKLDEIENQLNDLASDREKLRAGQMEWKKMQDEIDQFVAWALKFKETYPEATYEEKRRALRHFGIVAYLYRKNDPDHKQYDIKVMMPDLRDIVLPTTRRPRFPSSSAGAPVVPRIGRDTGLA